MPHALTESFDQLLLGVLLLWCVDYSFNFQTFYSTYYSATYAAFWTALEPFVYPLYSFCFQSEPVNQAEPNQCRLGFQALTISNQQAKKKKKKKVKKL